MIKKIFNSKIYFLYLSIFTCIYTVYAFHTFTLDDVYLHTAIGNWIIQNKTIPQIGILNWFAEENNLIWYAHEWLSEIVLFIIWQVLNKNILLIEIFCMILCFSFLIFIIRINYIYIKKHFYQSYVFLLILSISFYSFFVFRPQIFSFILFAIELYLLYQYYYYKENKFLYFIPFISLLWVNLHGGSSCLAYYLPIAFGTFLCFPFNIFNITHKFTKLNISKNNVFNFFKVAIICICIQLINPYSYHMLLYPYTNMNDTIMLSLISEWFPLNITNTGHLFIGFTTIFYVFFTLFTTNKKIDIVDFSLWMVFLIMTLKSVRFAMYFNIFSSLTLFKYFYITEQKRIVDLKHNILLTLFISIILFILSYTFYNTNKFMITENPIGKHIEMINIIKQENPQRIFNFDCLSNELLYLNIKPFSDGRADIFTKTIYNDSLTLLKLDKYPESIIAKYNFDYILLANTEPLNWYLEHNNNNYKLLLNDGEYSFYKIIKPNKK